MESIWKKTADTKKREPLTGNTDVEVVIIGGGMAGILTAYYLKQYGIEAVVLEAKKVGSGQTGNTTAKITSQHNLIYHKLISGFGMEYARQYASANERAVREYRQLIEKNHISCQWQDCPSYLFTMKENNLLDQEAKAAGMLGIQADIVSETELPFPVWKALKFHGQARFHPLQFLYEIAQQVTVYENTPVLGVDGCDVKTKEGTVSAKKVVFACHYPFILHPGYYFMRMHQERSYVLALETGVKLDGMYLGIDQPSLSFRSFENYILLGGGGHRTGENTAGGRYEELRRQAKAYWPDCKEAARWSAQDCMTLDGVPYIGPFSNSAPDWYVATGFGKWGMTSSMVSAMIISDDIAGKKNTCAEVFSPQRFVFSESAKSLFEDGVKAAKGLTREIFHLPKEKLEELPIEHGGVVEYEGKKAGVYKDKKGKAFVVSVKCPHLGCQLEWNPDEKSWDCPCHGSRFDIHGNVIDGPAQKSIALD